MQIPAGARTRCGASVEMIGMGVIRLKKIVVVVLALLMGLSLVSGLMAAAKDTPVKVMVNGHAAALKPAAFVRGGTVYLPLNATAAAVGASVKQDKAVKGHVVTSGAKQTTIKESQGIKVKGQLMVPLSVLSSALDCSSKWDAAAKTVDLSMKTAEAKPKPGAGQKPKSGG